MTKGFTIGVGLALLAGVLVSVAQTSVSRTYDPSPITVPVGHFGDALTYTELERGALHFADRFGHHAAETPPANAELPWRVSGNRTHQVGETSYRVPDRTGAGHEGILVTTNLTQPKPSTVREYYNLTTRELVRQVAKVEIGPSQWSRVESRFGPFDEQLAPLGYQGLTFQLHDDLTGVTQNRFMGTWHLTPEEREAFTFSSIVAERALVDGHDSYGIHSTGKVVFDAPTPYAPYGQREFLGRLVPLRLPIEFTQLTWVTSDSPYPILVQNTLKITAEAGDDFDAQPRTDTLESMLQLTEFKPGSKPIPWRPLSTISAPAVPDYKQREPGRPFPSDQEAQLRYDLTSADQSVRQDPRLIQFQRWRAEHPGAVLVSAALAPRTYGSEDVDVSIDTLQWTLYYATPEGSAFGVLSAKPQTESDPLKPEMNSEIGGQQRVPSFNPASIPTNPITMGTARLWWQQVAHIDYRLVEPNVVQWGFEIGTTANVEQLKRLTIGYRSPQLAAQTQRGSTLTVETDTGNLVSASEWQLRWDLVLTPRVPRAGQPQVEPKTILAGVQAPTIERTATSTTGAIAVFSLLYFFPLLKFLGAQAIVFTPGYAKLRKDELLRNKVRDDLLLLIRQEPGIHASDLARRVEAGWGTIVYHLSVLEKNKVISSLVDGRHKRFFPVGEVDWSKRGQLAVLRNEMTKSLFALIAHEPGVIQGEIANRSGLSVPATIWHLKRLEDAGLIGRDKQGRKVHYFPNDPNASPAPEPYDPNDAVEVV